MCGGGWSLIGASVALVTLQLHTVQDFHQVVPGFPDHDGQVERAKLVGDFATTIVVVVATVNVEDILYDGGQGP